MGESSMFPWIRALTSGSSEFYFRKILTFFGWVFHCGVLVTEFIFVLEKKGLSFFLEKVQLSFGQKRVVEGRG